MAKVAFTAGRVSGFRCPPGKAQAFLWDSTVRGLGLRVTPAGKPAFVFQGAYDGKDLRITIGGLGVWSISQAQAKARELQRMIDEGNDPRGLKRQALAESKAEQQRHQEAQQAAALQAVTVSEAWQRYTQERAPSWGTWHLSDHVKMTRAGGEKATRGTRGRGSTLGGPLHELMGLPLVALTPTVVEDWARVQGIHRPTMARLAWRLLRAFLNWCQEHPEFGQLVGARNPAIGKATRAALGRSSEKSDSLQKEQLATWFAHVQKLPNPAISAFLQILLLTGARPGEVLALRWEDVNWKWYGLQIRDKVEGTREIPLTPYTAHLLAALPRHNGWVFANPRTATHLTLPNRAHTRACKAAGIDGLTLHGLRRSFASVTVWLEVPVGVVAQIQGHKPSAIAEKHYIRRPLDLLRMYHERIEAWILEMAGVQFDRKAEPGKLVLVA